jgi:hypothetical protein
VSLEVLGIHWTILIARNRIKGDTVRFSIHFSLAAQTYEDDWFDPLLNSDTPLYIDPFLVFEDDDLYWAEARQITLEFFALALSFVQLSGGRRSSPHWLKAQRMLTFPEPREFALGLSMGHPEGSGAGALYAQKMTEALGVLAEHGVSEIQHIQTFSLFCEGLGVDRISDIFCNILKTKFIEYTQAVAARHDIPLEGVPVKHTAWNRATGRWSTGRIDLPPSPAFTGGVLLVPKRFLKDIPLVTADTFWSWADAQAGEELRGELNYEFNASLSIKEKRAAGRAAAQRHPGLALRYVTEVAGGTHEPYDMATDPDLLVGWAEAGETAAKRLMPLNQPDNAEMFHDWVEKLMLEFQHAVEEQDLWRVFWDDALVKPRKEKIVQAVAAAMFAAHCRAANVEISREVDMGRGPVDFKFSQGSWAKRALIEVKLMNSSKFFTGASKQLPQYLRTEKIDFGIYLCIGFSDEDFAAHRIKRVDDTLRALSIEKGISMKPLYVDARHTNKQSASTIK